PQHSAIGAGIGRPGGEPVFAQGLANTGKVVADEKRLPGPRQIVHLVGLVAFARHRALKMRHETGKLGCQIVVIRHNVACYLASPRGRNTTKWDSEKFTAKLTRIEISFAGSKGSRYESANKVAVLDIIPAMPDAAKAA